MPSVVVVLCLWVRVVGQGSNTTTPGRTHTHTHIGAIILRKNYPLFVINHTPGLDVQLHPGEIATHDCTPEGRYLVIEGGEGEGKNWGEGEVSFSFFVLL